MKKYLNAVIVLIAFHSINVISQDDVEEIVVTSAFIDTSEINNPLYVIDGSEFSDGATTSLGDAIDEYLGVSIADYGAAVGQPIIRGMSGPRVKILKNGVVNRDVSGLGVDHLNDVDLHDISQVEIVKGPSSLLYANGTIGGIINIVDDCISALNYELPEISVGYETQSVNDGNAENFNFKNNINGFNVTIPYKEKIIGYLDEIEESAKNIGAVNTIKILKNKLVGYNTDYLGFINSFNKKLDYKNVLILGSGGASKAIQYAIKTKKINFDVASRKSDVNHIAYTQIESLEKYDLIVNCTPLGTYPNVNDKPDLNYDQLNDKHLCYDLIYNPSETLFLNESKKRGARILNGLQMLKLQAEESWKIWNS